MSFSVAAYASDSFLIGARVKGVDLTDGWAIWFTVRLNDVVIITKKSVLAGGSSTQIEIVDAYHFRVFIATTDTSRSPANCECDAFITKGTERIQIIEPQLFEITKAITRSFV